MKSYKVLVAFNLNGSSYAVGQRVDLSDKDAANLGNKVQAA